MSQAELEHGFDETRLNLQMPDVQTAQMNIRRMYDLSRDRTYLSLCWDYRTVPQAFGGGMCPVRILHLFPLPRVKAK